ncbi:hypothetical protein ACOMHN_042785 [Nucella lapillus]
MRPPWHSQPVLHRVASAGILVSTVIFIVALAVPAWTRGSGLWMTCGPSLCVSNLHSQAGAWMTAVRVAECVALLAYVLCCFMEVLQGCFLICIRSPYSRAVEILGGVAGVTSIAGAVVFAVCWTSNTSQGDHRASLHWGFGLVVIASILILLSALAIGCSRHKHSHSARNSQHTSRLKKGGRYFIDDGGTFRFGDDPDSSSMMLVPASHFDTRRQIPVSDTSRTFDKRSDPPPPYALPPPYPYRSAGDFFLPIASSSVLGPPSGSGSVAGHCQGMNGVNESLSVAGTDRVLTMPSQSFISSTSTFCIQSNVPVMRPLFIKTAEGGSEIEITPSAQNSSGLPSPFSHF